MEYLTEGLLAHGGGAVLDLEEQLHDPPLVRLVLLGAFALAFGIGVWGFEVWSWGFGA